MFTVRAQRAIWAMRLRRFCAVPPALKLKTAETPTSVIKVNCTRRAK